MNREFNWGAWIGGLAIALVIGGGGNIIGGLVALSLKSHFYGFLVGAIAGAIFIVLGFTLRRTTPGIAYGMLCGGCVIALIGGACGASLVGTSFH